MSFILIFFQILIRNIPFQATRKEVKQLFATFGEIRSFRMPRKAGLFHSFVYGRNIILLSAAIVTPYRTKISYHLKKLCTEFRCGFFSYIFCYFYVFLRNIIHSFIFINSGRCISGRSSWVRFC